MICLSLQSYDPEDGYNDGPGPLVGSFPKDFGYGPDEHDDELPGGATAENKPRILLMGLRRYKKISIIEYFQWFL